MCAICTAKCHTEVATWLPAGQLQRRMHTYSVLCCLPCCICFAYFLVLRPGCALAIFAAVHCRLSFFVLLTLHTFLQGLTAGQPALLCITVAIAPSSKTLQGLGHASSSWLTMLTEMLCTAGRRSTRHGALYKQTSRLAQRQGSQIRKVSFSSCFLQVAKTARSISWPEIDATVHLLSVGLPTGGLPPILQQVSFRDRC
jgi:hypothetical protein